MNLNIKKLLEFIQTLGEKKIHYIVFFYTMKIIEISKIKYNYVKLRICVANKLDILLKKRLTFRLVIKEMNKNVRLLIKYL